MNSLRDLGRGFLFGGIAGVFLLQTQVVPALLTTTSRLDLPDATYADVRAEGRACVTVQDGGRVEDYVAAGESFTAVQTGAIVDDLKVTGSSTAHICGGAVRALTVDPGATVRMTGGSIESVTVKAGGCIHVYGTRITRGETNITGSWLDGTGFTLPFPAGDGSVVVHDSTTEAIPETGPYAHYRLDEAGNLRTYDGTTFLHRAAGGNYVTSIPDSAPFPGPKDSASVTTGMPPLTGSGSSAWVTGGGAATIPGSKLPDLDEGAAISFWIRINSPGPRVQSLVSKAVTETGGHPRSMALCLMSGGQMIWISDGGVHGPSTPITIGETYHIVMTYTPNGASLSGDLYVNGQFIGSGIGGKVDTPQMNFNIGGWAGPEAGIDGLLDDVQIYDRPLAATEVNKLYANPGLTLTDLDNDTMLDDFEYATFGSLAQEPGDDYDRDGLSNEAELNSTRTDPGSYASRLSIVSFQSEGERRTVVFTSVPGVSYQLEHSIDGIGWNAVGPTVTAVVDRTTLTHTSANPRGLFRVATR